MLDLADIDPALRMSALGRKADIMIRRHRTSVRSPRDTHAMQFEDAAECIARNQRFASDSLMFDQRVVLGSINWDGM
jgi:hypothetical protein